MSGITIDKLFELRSYLVEAHGMSYRMVHLKDVIELTKVLCKLQKEVCYKTAKENNSIEDIKNSPEPLYGDETII